MSIYIAIDKWCYSNTISSLLGFRSKKYIHAIPVERAMLESHLPILCADKHQGWMGPSSFRDR